jgi:hypothetical protein
VLGYLLRATPQIYMTLKASGLQKKLKLSSGQA